MLKNLYNYLWGATEEEILAEKKTELEKLFRNRISQKSAYYQNYKKTYPCNSKGERIYLAKLLCDIINDFYYLRNLGYTEISCKSNRDLIIEKINHVLDTDKKHDLGIDTQKLKDILYELEAPEKLTQLKNKIKELQLLL